MALDVYFSATPNGWKISIMLEELREAGVELPETRIHMVDLSAGDQFTPEFTAINPNQKMPALVDDGRAVMESCAILQYLGEKYPTPLYPTDERRWDVLPWLYWQAANLGPAFRGVAYGVPKDEVDSFSKERRERYKARGAQIAANENLRTSI